MGKMLLFELRKLFRQKSFYICGIVVTAIMILSVFMCYSVEQVMNHMDGMSNMMSEYNGCYMLLSAIPSASVSLILAIFISIYVCSEYSDMTIRNIIARGYTRAQFYVTKLVVSCLVAVIYIVLVWLAAFSLGTLIWGMGDGFAPGMVLRNLAIQVLVTLGEVAMYHFFAALFQKLGAAIALGILVPTLMRPGVMAIDYLTKYKYDFADYFSTEALNNVANVAADHKTVLHAVIGGFVYLVLFGVAGWLVSRRREL